MRAWALILLTAVSVWGFPQSRKEEEHFSPKLVQGVQEKNPNKAREIQRDCKGKCAANIAQKAAAEAKAAQQAQNAAGAQAAHMVSSLLPFGKSIASYAGGLNQFSIIIIICFNVEGKYHYDKKSFEGT